MTDADDRREAELRRGCHAGPNGAASAEDNIPFLLRRLDEARNSLEVPRGEHLFPKITVRLVGEDGNAFILNRYRQAIRQAGLKKVTKLCPYCHRPLTSNLSRDHILPRRMGGTDRAENIRIVHSYCNHLREHANDCVGALACAWAVAEDTNIISTSSRIICRVRSVLRQWRLTALRWSGPAFIPYRSARQQSKSRGV